MNDLIKRIKAGDRISEIIQCVVHDIYENGPINGTTMEILCYLSIYQSQEFEKWENRILKYMGVYYKKIKTDCFPEVIFGMYEKHIEELFNDSYTPVQANLVSEIQKNKCFSFSAPTSTGKSYVFQHLIRDSKNDIVIVVPSRALINEYFNALCNTITDKSVNILTFIDKINIKRAKRNIFIVTPERCKEIYKQKEEFVIDIFLFDEAQLSNEESSRGIFFDSIVRRAQKAFPDAKFVFAHPFVENPEAQIQKNHFNINDSGAICYKYRNVGQIFYAVDENRYYHFGIDKEIMGKHKVACEFDPIETVINHEGSVLVYTTKASIYNKKVFSKFKKYINMCAEINDENAKKYIKQIKKYIGANDNSGEERYSQMIDLMKHGIVIHHGSLPLQARLLLEQFTNAGYCKICFATSTLEQGINMPFDIVYLNTFEASKPLSLKNLIGRAGRSTLEQKFDFGSIVIKKGDMTRLRHIINSPDILDNVSMLESEVEDDLKEFKDAIIDGTISDEYNISEKQLTKLCDENAENIVKNILDTMFENNDFVSLSSINEDQECKLWLYTYFEQLYENYLGRTLNNGEKNVFNTAIKILLWQIHCKSFKDICFYRYSYASKKQEREQLQKQIQNGNEFESYMANLKLQHLQAAFVTGYADIPNKNLQAFNMFGNNAIKAKDVDYDRIVFDTYDYLDKIIGFKLSDIFYAAFNEYFEKKNDLRAKRMAQLVKYGTEDEKEIWMLRYGFSFEDIEWLEPYIKTINQEEIIFDREIDKLSIEKMNVIKRFI
jgi:ATP-dependent RNA helicase DOB1